MRRLLLLASLTLLSTALLHGSASAVTGFEVTAGASFTASGVLTMNSGSVICDVSLSGELESSWSASSGETMGAIDRGSITNCSGLATDGIALTPLSLRYDSYSGTYPDLTAIHHYSPDFAFGINTALGVCLYGGSLDDLDMGVDTASTTITFNNASIPKASGSFLCPSSASLAGDLTTANRVVIYAGGRVSTAWLPSNVEDFGTVAPGSSARGRKTFKNTSALEILRITRVELTGRDADSFDYDAARLHSGIRLAPGATDSVNIDMRFNPDSGAPADTPHVADLQITLKDTTGRTYIATMIMRGRTTP